jgi:hypothetical protein
MNFSYPASVIRHSLRNHRNDIVATSALHHGLTRLKPGSWTVPQVKNASGKKIVCTGDLMESQLAYMGDAQFDEWIATLDSLKKLDFETDLPGHGTPFKDKGLITAYQGYLRDLMKQVADLRKQGVPAEAAAQKVDLTAYKTSFPQIQGPGADIRGVRRLYEWMDAKK